MAGYAELIAGFALRPIKNDEELERATEVLYQLSFQDACDQDVSDYSDVLSDIVQKYDDANHPMPDVGHAAMINHLLEAKGFSLDYLADSTDLDVARIMDDEYDLRVSEIIKLARFFKVNPAVFLPDRV